MSNYDEVDSGDENGYYFESSESETEDPHSDQDGHYSEDECEYDGECDCYYHRHRAMKMEGKKREVGTKSWYHNGPLSTTAAKKTSDVIFFRRHHWVRFRYAPCATSLELPVLKEAGAA
jgi:hypothetical protein